MAPTIDQFTEIRGWTITDWVLTGDGQLPDGGFVKDGGLLVALVSGATGPSGACQLVWMDAELNVCTMVLQFAGGELIAENVVVRFGSLEVVCDLVTVRLLDTAPPRLSGQLRTPGSDGNAGTFAAEANAGPPATEPS